MTRKTLLCTFCLLASTVSAQYRTRTEAIEAQRRNHQARLWPERESPLVEAVNNLVERGLYDGARSGKGANGAQFVLGGTRSGQGMSVGVGYRRTDFWQERLGIRGTARITPQLAYMFDAEVDFQSLETERLFVDFYTKYENSPQMDFYGQGGDSSLDNLSSYLYEDLTADFRIGYNIREWLRLGGTIGAVAVHTGPGKRSGVPSLDEAFTPEQALGFGMDTWYSRWGGFIEVDYRDLPGGPRSGGYYSTTIRQYEDEGLDTFNFTQMVFEIQQYIPYFNKNRVIAFRLLAEITSEDEGSAVIPFYLQPKLGGNDDLRGFQRYRFYDNQAIIASVEHRWYASSVLDMAIFADAGKVAPKLRDVDFSELEWSAGIGFRFKVQDAYIMRIDFAAGREGFRWMWTFSDIFKTKWGIY